MEALKRNDKLTVNKTIITKFHLGKVNHARSRGGAHYSITTLTSKSF